MATLKKAVLTDRLNARSELYKVASFAEPSAGSETPTAVQGWDPSETVPRAAAPLSAIW